MNIEALKYLNLLYEYTFVSTVSPRLKGDIKNSNYLMFFLKNIPVIELAETKDYKMWSMDNGVLKFTIHEDDLIDSNGSINKKHICKPWDKKWVKSYYETSYGENIKPFSKYVCEEFVEFIKTINIDDINVSRFAEIASKMDYSASTSYINIYVEAESIFRQSKQNIDMRSCLFKYVKPDSTESKADIAIYGLFLDYIQQCSIDYIRFICMVHIIGFHTLMMGHLDSHPKNNEIMRKYTIYFKKLECLEKV